MKDYHVLSLDDIENGEVTDHGVILALEDVPWAAGQLWDSDVCKGNDGRYYLYFSAKDHNGLFHIGVAIADKPEGPFKAEPYPMYGSYSIDPCAFKDEDGEVYIYFGGLWGGQLQRYKDNKILENANLPEGDAEALPSRVARLTADGLQFAETPKPVVILDENGKPLKANDPQLLQPVVGWTTHHCITEYKGQWYLFHHDCVPSNGITWLRSLKVAPLRIEGEKLYLNV